MRKDLEEKVNKRIAILQGLMTLAFILLTGWLFGVQVLDLSGYKAKGIAIRSTDSPTLRGNILDRNGMKLAQMNLTMMFMLIRHFIQRKDLPNFWHNFLLRLWKCRKMNFQKNLNQKK